MQGWFVNELVRYRTPVVHPALALLACLQSLRAAVSQSVGASTGRRVAFPKTMRCLCIVLLARGVTAPCSAIGSNKGCTGTSLSGVPFGANPCLSACAEQGRANVQADGYVYLASYPGCICCDGSTPFTQIGIDFFRCTMKCATP